MTPIHGLQNGYRQELGRMDVHPKIATILSRIEDLATRDTPNSKVLPIGAALSCLAQCKWDRCFDPNESTVSTLQLTVAPRSCQEKLFGLFAALFAAAGKQEAIHAVHSIMREPLPKSSFEAFGSYIHYQASKLSQSQAALYALQFHSIPLEKSSTIYRSHPADSDNFGGFGIAIVQHFVGNEVRYQIVDSGVQDTLGINRLMHNSNTRRAYQWDELTEILKKIEVLVSSCQWGENEHNAWKDLGGTNQQEWKGKNVAKPPSFNWSASLLQLDKSTLGPLDRETDLIENFSTLSVDSIDKEGDHAAYIDFKNWPRSLENLAMKSTRAANKLFCMLQDVLENANPLVLKHAASYHLKKKGITTGKHKIVTNYTCAASNCSLSALALCSLLISDPEAPPETTIKSGRFRDDIAATLDAAERDLLKTADSARAKLFQFSTDYGQFQSDDGSDSSFSGHDFVLLQFLDPNNNVRYLLLDSYVRQRHLLERLSLRNPADPSWTRGELDQFISLLKRLDKAAIWDEEFASDYNEAFGAFHPGYLGKRFPNTQQGLCLQTKVYPVDMNEVCRRNSPSMDLPVKDVEILLAPEFFERRNEKFPSELRGWWTEEIT